MPHSKLTMPLRKSGVDEGKLFVPLPKSVLPRYILKMSLSIDDVDRGMFDIERGIVDVEWGIDDIEKGILVVEQAPLHVGQGTANMAQSAEDKGVAAQRLLFVRKTSRNCPLAPAASGAPSESAERIHVSAVIAHRENRLAPRMTGPAVRARFPRLPRLCIMRPQDGGTRQKENAMKTSWKAWIGVAALLVAAPLLAQQSAKEAEKEAGNPAEYEKILKPADKHEILNRLAGTWKGEFKVLIYGPQKEATMTQDFVGQWILKDNFFEIDLNQDIRGSKLKAKILLGYNGAWRRFYQLYMTDGEPRGTYSKGVFLKAKNTLLFTGTEDDPISGDSYERLDFFNFLDKDKIGYQLVYRFADGSEMKVADGTYTRMAAAAK
jgi:hypothetical protein